MNLDRLEFDQIKSRGISKGLILRFRLRVGIGGQNAMGMPCSDDLRVWVDAAREPGSDCRTVSALEYR
jgi:hypothetical protein